jgi:Nickel responsive protein SCO4226-like
VPRYLIERRIHAELSDDEADGLSLRSATLLATDFPDLHWEHSHAYVDDDGTRGSMCVYTAASVDAIRAHASALGGHEIVRIVEISGDISPADFPL